jgi:hypothetical protein
MVNGVYANEKTLSLVFTVFHRPFNTPRLPSTFSSLSIVHDQYMVDAIENVCSSGHKTGVQGRLPVYLCQITSLATVSLYFSYMVTVANGVVLGMQPPQNLCHWYAKQLWRSAREVF